MSKEQVREGDTVRVVLEGEAVEPTDGSFRIGGYGRGNRVFCDETHVTSIEVVKRAAPQVGDAVEGEEAYAALPVGSVVQGWGDILLRTREGLAHHEHRLHPTSDWDLRRTVVFIPEQSA